MDESPSTSWQCPDINDVQPPTEKKHSKTTCPSTCAICRNAAAGYHYDVPSCNGCKTFFRRTIMNGAKLKCVKESDCLAGTQPVDMSRRVCRFCRFEKCIEAGMNPMAISFENDQSESSRSLFQEVLRRRAQRGFVASAGINTHEDKINRIINRLGVMECKVDKIHTNGIPIGFDDTRSLEDILKAKAIFTSSDVPNLKALGHKFRPNVAHYLHCSFLASLEHSKTFDFSKKLDFEEKLILLKRTAASCAHLITAYFTISNYRSDTLMLPDGTRADENIAQFKKVLNVPHKPPHKTLRMLQRNRVDRVEYMLLKAIVMCNPAVSGLSKRSQRILDAERQNYTFCLHRYCSLQEGAVHGSVRLAELLSMVCILELEVKKMKDVHFFLKAMFSIERVKSMFPPLCITKLFDDILD